MKRYDTFSDAWWNEIHETRTLGDERMPRGLETRDRRWVQFSVKDSLSFPVAAEGRTFRDVIGVLEGLSLVGQTSIPETFTSRVKGFARFTDDGVFHGAYGIRAYGHLGEIVELLKKDPDSRQAVITFYDSSQDLGKQKRDIPCTLNLHFQVVGPELEMRVTMRSNDLWIGTPYDFVQFAMVQASVAQALGLLPGAYTHSVGSLHLYSSDIVDLMKISEPINERMTFPLWSGENLTIEDISRQARQLLLWPDTYAHINMTGFEFWATTLLG